MHYKADVVVSETLENQTFSEMHKVHFISSLPPKEAAAKLASWLETSFPFDYYDFGKDAKFEVIGLDVVTHLSVIDDEHLQPGVQDPALYDDKNLLDALEAFNIESLASISADCADEDDEDDEDWAEENSEEFEESEYHAESDGLYGLDGSDELDEPYDLSCDYTAIVVTYKLVGSHRQSVVSQHFLTKEPGESIEDMLSRYEIGEKTVHLYEGHLVNVLS